MAEAYKRDKSARLVFPDHRAIVHDQRVLSWKRLDRVSILTQGGVQDSVAKFRFVDSAKEEVPVKVLCRLPGVSCSRTYAGRWRRPSQGA